MGSYLVEDIIGWMVDAKNKHPARNRYNQYASVIQLEMHPTVSRCPINDGVTLQTVKNISVGFYLCHLAMRLHSSLFCSLRSWGRDMRQFCSRAA